jgi:tetratricopeptide (TPR) repeat protein
MFALDQRNQHVERQASIAGAFAITYDALRAEQQQLFRRLGSFASGSLALVHVAGVLEQEPAVVKQWLDDLVSVAYLGYDQARPGHYTLHPLLRSYASQLLAEAGEREAAEQRHMTYFLAFAEANQEVEPAAWDRLESALPDLLLAVEVAVRRGEQPALRTFGGALVGNSEFLSARGYNQAAREVLGHMLAACRVLEDVEGEAAALGNLGVLARDQGDYAAAHAYHGQALALHKGLGNLLGQATALANQGAVATDQGDYSGARSYLQQALELDTVLGNLLGQAQDLCNLGVVAINQGDYAAARFYLQRSAALYRQLGLAVHPAVAQGLDRVSEHSPGDGHGFWRRFRP